MTDHAQRLPALFVPHGSPAFILEPGAAGAALRRIAADLPKPRAIVVVSAHWDTAEPTLGLADPLDTIHDFWGFPAALYDIRYPARNDLAVAEKVRRLLRQAGIEPKQDNGRGLDHGAWTPLLLMYPAADIPVIPLSLQSRLGPEHHYRLGQALAPLLEEGVLVLASGNLTHNLRDYQMAAFNGNQTPAYVGEFAQWISQRVESEDIAGLLDYRAQAPHAVRAHPSDEHLLPLYVALGAAGAGYRAERRYQGIDSVILAMDSYALWPAASQPQPQPQQ